MCMTGVITKKQWLSEMRHRGPYYKIVKKRKDGKYASLYDGMRVYTLGKWEKARPLPQERYRGKMSPILGYYAGIHCLAEKPYFDEVDKRKYVLVEVEVRGIRALGDTAYLAEVGEKGCVGIAVEEMKIIREVK